MWASPPCTQYSRAPTVGARHVELANTIDDKTIETIDYLNPTYHILENP